MITLSITPRNQLKRIRFLLDVTAMILVGLVIVRLFFPDYEKSMLIASAFYWTLVAIPVLILHGEYYSKNKGQVVKILESQLILTNEEGATHKYEFSELQKIILYKSGNLDKSGGIQLLPMESYHYARIITKSGLEVIVTCLMSANLEEDIRHIKWVSFERKKRIFAGLRFSPHLLND